VDKPKVEDRGYYRETLGGKNWYNDKLDGNIETSEGVIPAEIRSAVNTYVHFKEQEFLEDLSLAISVTIQRFHPRNSDAEIKL